MSNEVDRLRLRDLFVSDYLEKLFYFCLKKTGNAHEAEDLASDISLTVLTAIEKGAEIKRFSAWVWRIARNRYASWVADKSAERTATCPGDVSEYGVAAEDDRPEDELAQAEQIGRLRRELAFISSDYREIVVAYYVKQKRIFEIAKSLSVPEGTVKTKLYRARKKLKEGMPLQPGDTVRIKGQTSVGTLERIDGTSAVALFGGMRTKLRLERLEHADPSALASQTKSSQTVYTPTESRMTRTTIDAHRSTFKQDLDVRGLRGDEAINQVQYFIDDAILVGVSRVRILHGKGNGILRQLIRQYLATVPNVVDSRDEHVQFGGAGITVVDLE